jgi:hypothetical protein
MNQFKGKKQLMAVGVAAALSLPGAAGAINNNFLFNETGGDGGTGSTQLYTEFVMKKGNAILTNVAAGQAVPAGGLGGTSTTIAVTGDFMAQAIAGGVGLGNPACAGVCSTYYFTYVFTVPVTGSLTLDSTPTKNELVLDGTGTLGTFKMYASTTAPNMTAGTGYDTGIEILSGDLAIDPATSVTVTEDGTAFPNPYDGGGTRSNLGTIGNDTVKAKKTVTLNGGASVLIDVNTYDDDFFKSDISTLTLNLGLGSNAINSADGNIIGAGFRAAFEPSVDVNGSVNGTAANFGTNAINDFYCDSAVSATCDIQLQITGNVSLNSVPEPGSLALLGLGMGALGFGLRRRRKAA